MHAIPTKITPNTIYSIKPPLLFYFSYLFTFFVYCLVDKKCNDDTKTQEHQSTDDKPSLYFLVICNAPASYRKECRYHDSKPKAQHCKPFFQFVYLCHSAIIAQNINVLAKFLWSSSDLGQKAVNSFLDFIKDIDPYFSQF